MKKLLLLAFILLSLAAHAQTDSAVEMNKVRVTAVHDAQVLTVYSEEYDEEFVLVLIEMFAPGLDQPFGKEARDYVAKAVLGKTVQLGLAGTGAAGAAGVIYIPEGKRLDVALVENGLAQVDTSVGVYTNVLEYQAEAQRKKLGIWKDGRAVDLSSDWLAHHPKVREELERHRDEQQEAE